MSGEGEDEEQKRSLPPWMATFADLMSLLMCFFVLLLSFSEMDVQKYKQVAGSMADAFGVQNQIDAAGIPAGTSIIAQEFSPGLPQPTLENVIQQMAEETAAPSLQTGQEDFGEDADAARQALLEQLDQIRQQTQSDAETLGEALEQQVSDGLIDIESGLQAITIRIRERGSFGSGSASLNVDFLPVMQRLREVLGEINGRISVEGHTDDIPIATGDFPSNWYLSSQRALSVAHEILREGDIDDDQFMIVGFADTKPYAPNDTPENRAKNRRVEIVIQQEMAQDVAEELRALGTADDDLLDTLGVTEDELAELN